MQVINTNLENLEPYNDNTLNQNQINPEEKSKELKTQDSDLSSIHNSAVNLSISMQSLKVFINIKSIELTQTNTNAQHSLVNIINNAELYDFISGKENDNKFNSLSSEYLGKPIAEIKYNEAKELVSDNGFFGIEETSQRVSSFAINFANDNIEVLQEAREGITEGFDETKQLWGEKLSEIFYQTQEKTLDIIDKKIEELLKTNEQKELEKN